MNPWRRRGPKHRAFIAFGVAVGVALDDPELWPAVERILPPGRVECEPSQASLSFALQVSGAETYTVTVAGHPWVEHATLEIAVGVLDQQLRLFVAARAPDVIFVHAGVVAVANRALVIPGQSFTGKTTLVKELVESGAVYYSDEYAVLDAEGMVHSYPRPLSLRGNEDGRGFLQDVHELGGVVAQGPAELAVVVLTRYRAHAQWRPEPRSTSDGAVMLLANAVPAQDRPRQALQVLSRAVRGARILKGERGDARGVAPRLLEELAQCEHHRGPAVRVH